MLLHRAIASPTGPVAWLARHLEARPFALTLLAALVATAGCGQGPKLAPVKGRVVFRDQPLTFGGVMFQPEAGQPARGVIQSDGSFRLTTNHEGDGALVGRHRVRVTCFPSQAPTAEDVASQGEAPTGGSLIPTRYNDFSTSELIVEVPEAGRDDVVLELKD